MSEIIWIEWTKYVFYEFKTAKLWRQLAQIQTQIFSLPANHLQAQPQENALGGEGKHSPTRVLLSISFQPCDS